MTKFHKGFDYFTGREENLGEWQKGFRTAMVEEEFGSGKTEGIEKWSMLKITDEEKALNLTEKVVKSMGWDIDSSNWHGFIGSLTERTNNKLSGKMARKSLQKLVDEKVTEQIESVRGKQ